MTNQDKNKVRDEGDEDEEDELKEEKGEEEKDEKDRPTLGPPRTLIRGGLCIFIL